MLSPDRPLRVACSARVRRTGVVVRRRHRQRVASVPQAPAAGRRPPRAIVRSCSRRSIRAPASASSSSATSTPPRRLQPALKLSIAVGRPPSRASRPFDRCRADQRLERTLAQGDGFAEQRSEPATSTSCWRSRRRPQRPRPRRPSRHDLAARSLRHRHPAERQGAVVRAAVHRPAEGLPRRGPEPRGALPADDPGRLPGRRAAARPRLRAAGRERLQAERAVARQGQGHLAVHARHRARERPASTTGTSTSAPIRKRPRAPPPSTSRRSTACSTATGTWRWPPTTAAPAACSAR